jgi:phosphate-selective porin OprO and OprP
MLKATLTFGASCLALAGVASAQTAITPEDPRDTRIRELEQRLEDLSARVEAMDDDAPQAAAPAAPAETNPVRVTLSNGRPTIQTADNSSKLSFRSLVQFDAAAYDQEEGASVDLSSGTNFRRARLGVEGTAFEDWNYELTFEFGGSGQEDAGKVLAAWVEYGGLDFARVRIGAMAPSAGLDDATSSGDLIFLERAAASEMARGIAAGDGRSAIALIGGDERWFGSVALTGGVAAAAAGYDEQYAIVARAAGLPISNDSFAVHLGANYTNVIQPPDSTAGAGDASMRLQERPELRVDGTRLVDTGALNADGMSIAGLEAGVQSGRLLLTGEAIWFDIDRNAALPDAEFGGWHVQAVWSLTGEERAWSQKTGAFSSARVAHSFDPAAGHWGAWEVAGRYSMLDLNDNEGATGLSSTMVAPTDIVRGGEQEIATIGVNWRPNNMLRFMLDYQSIEIDRENAAGTADIGQSIDAISLRTQFGF